MAEQSPGWRRIEGVAIGAVATIVAAAVLGWATGLWDRIRGPEAQLLTWQTTLEAADGCLHWAVPGAALESLPVPSDPLQGRDDERSWLRGLGAKPAGGARVTVDVQGQTAQSVVLEGMDVVVDSRKQSAIAFAINPNPGCGSTFRPRLFKADLRSESPRAVAQPGAPVSGKELPRVDFPYQVSTSEPEQFLIDVTLDADEEVRFHVEIPWHSGRERGRLVIRDTGGQPFTVVGRLDVPGYYPEDGKWQRLPQ
jgi:hypothetical protein